MEMSKKAKRMQAHHKRKKGRTSALNMVALMDIFTILVFFLLVSTSSEEVLPIAKNLELPISTSKVLPKESLVIAITDKQILLQGRPVLNRADLAKDHPLIIQALLNSLKIFLQSQEAKDLNNKIVTIMGDKDIHYSLIKSVMATASQAGYERISFAVAQAQDKGK